MLYEMCDIRLYPASRTETHRSDKTSLAHLVYAVIADVILAYTRVYEDKISNGLFSGVVMVVVSTKVV